MIKWIFFDIGSTLVDESMAYRRRIEKTIADSEISYGEFYSKMLEFHTQNKKGDKEAAAYFNLKLSPWNKDDEAVYVEAEDCLETLNKKFKIGIIANQSLGSEDRLKIFGLLKYIDLVVASAEEEVAKPDLKIFEIALERAGCKACEAVMVGDRLDNDIVPANRLGMKTVWVRQGFWGLSTVRCAEEIPTLTIDMLNELCKRLPEIL